MVRPCCYSRKTVDGKLNTATAETSVKSITTETSVWTVLYRQQDDGVGSGSCGPALADKYRLDLKNLNFDFFVSFSKK